MNKLNLGLRLWLGIAFLFAIALFLCVAFLTRPQLSIRHESELTQAAGQSAEANDQDYVLKDIIEEIQVQKEIDEALMRELQAGTYTLQTPFVMVDPYGVSSLSALALFSTAEPMRISINITGKTNLDDVSFTFDGYTTDHQIPILGLYANEENPVTISGETKDGTIESTTVLVVTDPLPDDLQSISSVTYLSNQSQYQPGMNFLNSFGNKDCANAIDANGELRWLLSEKAGYIRTYNKGKALYTIRGNYICQYSFLGKILNVYYIPYGIHHDTYLTDHGTLIVCGNSEETIEDQLIEIDLATGETVHRIDYKDILQRTRVFGKFYSNVDWMHMNAVVEYNEGLIVSSNHQSTVICNDWNGSIRWMLCDPTGYYEHYKQYMLQPIGNNFEYPYNQHAVDVLPDYDLNPDTLDIILFDNGSSRSYGQQAKENGPPEQLYSRFVHYRINEKEKTIEQIWQYGKERPELFAYYRGDANLLPNGNILGVFCVERIQDTPEQNNINPVICEVNKDNQVVFECSLVSDKAENMFKSYRVERLPIYWPSANEPILGVSANLLISKEVLTVYDY